MLCCSSPPLLAREGVVGLPVLYFGMAVSGTPLGSRLLAEGSQTGSVALTLMTRLTGLAFGGGLSVMAGDLLWTPITSRFSCLAVPTRENKVPFFELGCLKLWAWPESQAGSSHLLGVFICTQRLWSAESPRPAPPPASCVPLFFHARHLFSSPAKVGNGNRSRTSMKVAGNPSEGTRLPRLAHWQVLTLSCAPSLLTADWWKDK